MSSIDLNAPEVQELIAAKVAEATSGLLKKRDELLGEVKRAKKNSDIDPDEFMRLREENEALSDKLAETNKQVKVIQGDAEKYKKALEAENGFVSRLLIDNGLNEAVLKAGVKPEFTKAVKSMLEKQVQLKADGDSRMPVIGEKGLAEFVAEWSKSDEGKHFVAAPANSGGGAQGGGKAQAKTKQMTRADFESKMAAGDQSVASFFKDGGQLVE